MFHFISHMTRARLKHGNEAEVGLTNIRVFISFKCPSKSAKHLLNSIITLQILFLYFCVVYPIVYITEHVTRAFKMALLHDRQL